MRILALDLGKSKSVGCFCDGNGGAYKFMTIITDGRVLHDALVEFGVEKLVIEICSIAGWVCDIAEGLGVKVEVANVNAEAWRWENVKDKSDRKDALKLLEMTLMGKLPTVYMPGLEVRHKRALIAYRHNLVVRRTAIKNSIRSIIDKAGRKMLSGSKAWSIAGMEKLAGEAKAFEDCPVFELWRGQLGVELDNYGRVCESIAKVESKLNELGEKDENVKLLETIPGVGRRLAEAMVSCIDDPHRFKSGKEVGSYLGLVPRRYQSGSTERYGRISGRGNVIVRSLLVEVAWLGLRHNSWMLAVFNKVMSGSKSRRKIAVTAVARRLAVVCWAMLRDGSRWQMVKIKAA